MYLQMAMDMILIDLIVGKWKVKIHLYDYVYIEDKFYPHSDLYFKIL